MFKVVWSKKAIKQLISITPSDQKAIKSKVSELANFSSANLDIKKLQNIDSQYRLRVGNYRIIFEIIKDTPVIINIMEVIRRQSKTY